MLTYFRDEGEGEGEGVAGASSSGDRWAAVSRPGAKVGRGARGATAWRGEVDDAGGEVRRSYDRVAAAYAAALYDELAGKPLDRALLDCFAEQVGGLGPVVDVGCGPGQVARYLAERGVPVRGLDLSAGMVATARRLNPGIPFDQGDMLALDAGDGAWGGIAAFYAIVHLSPQEVSRALGEFCRVLRPGGVLLLAFHAGEETIRRDELWGEPVALDFRFFPTAEIERRVVEAGFALEARIEREPYPEVEHPNRRAYLLGRRPLA